jgi:hypothetical protein
LANRFYGLVPAFGLALVSAAMYRWIIQAQPERRRKGDTGAVAAAARAAVQSRLRGKLFLMKAGR